MKLIRVQYSCNGCGLKMATFAMGERRDGEDIKDFMERMGVFLSRDHKMRARGCRSPLARDLYLPVDDDGVVGRDPKGTKSHA